MKAEPRVVTLGEVATVQSGFAFKSSQWTESGVPVVKIANVKSGRIDLGSNQSFVSEADAEKAARFRLKQGDIVIGMTGYVGEVAQVRTNEHLLLNQRVGLVQIEESKVDRQYLFHLMSGEEFRSEVKALAYGSAQPNISPSLLHSIEIVLPPIKEQRSIAATLGVLDDKIESNRRVGAIAEQLGDALFAAAASESRLLSEVADITMGSSPKGADLNEDGEGLPFYQGARDFGVRFPSLRVWTTAPVRTASKGDTLMSVRAPVGELNRASADCCIGRGVAAFHSDTHYSTLYYAMRCSSSAWDKFQGEGTVFASVNKTDVHGAEIRWVGDGAILELENKLRAIDARIESLESETQSLITLRDALLPELLSGRIRVPVNGVAA